MEFKIKNKVIGGGHPVFFIAEAGVNHNGSLELGKKLIDIASESGADAVKFQTFKAEELNTKNSPKSTYHIETTGNDNHQSWYDLLKSQEISEKMLKEDDLPDPILFDVWVLQKIFPLVDDIFNLWVIFSLFIVYF